MQNEEQINISHSKYISHTLIKNELEVDAKVLDTVFHSILLEKLAAHGLDRYTLLAKENFLDGQAQRVMGNGVKSR